MMGRLDLEQASYPSWLYAQQHEQDLFQFLREFSFFSLELGEEDKVDKSEERLEDPA